MFRRTNIFIKISVLVPLMVITFLLFQFGTPGSKPAAAQESGNLCPLDVATKVKGNVKVTGKPGVIALAVPDSMTAALDKIVQGLIGNKNDKANTYFDFKSAIYAFTSDTGQVRAIVVPLVKSGTTDQKKVDAKAPDDSKDIKFVGGVYVPDISDGVMVLVSQTDTFEIRLYDSSLKRVTSVGGKPLSFSLRKFTEKPADDKTTIPTEGDLGVKVAEQEICFTFKDMQACIQYPLQPDADAAKRIDDADTNLDAVYNYKGAGISFDTAHTVADLVGDDERNLCSSALTTYPFSGKSVNECKPTAVYTAPNIGKDQPLPTLKNFEGCGLIGIIDLTNQQGKQTPFKLDTKGNPEGEVYDGKGAKLSGLPSGQYLMFTMQPTAKPGDKVAILLADTSKKLFIIPGIRLEGFGEVQQGKDSNSKFSAFINDPGSGDTGMP